jgi:hypothetical protein
VWCCGRIPTFQRSMLPQSSPWTSEILVSYHKLHGITTQHIQNFTAVKASKLVATLTFTSSSLYAFLQPYLDTCTQTYPLALEHTGLPFKVS